MLLGTASGSREPVYLSPDRLTTHGVVVGMTGSGKTGFSLVLLEELILAGVPIIAIDPKGDLANLSLVFPEFRAEDFAPWCPEGDDPGEVASAWEAGLLKSGLTADRVAALKAKMDLSVYTPGSEAGIPVNALGSFHVPERAILEDTEAFSELVSTTVTGLLGLIGQNVDPLQDPAHGLLSQILSQAWEAGESLDLSSLIMRLVDPPFEKFGVFPVDTFYPPAARMQQAKALNAILAAPSFAPWQAGSPLNAKAMLTAGEKVPVSIFYLAHLSESERSFFISLLLSEILAHSRRLPGSSQLRGLLFFDEVAGYLPPHPKNPPTKAPLLTLMKQSRAVGIGILLSTQNPVDLDYKALSNAGLWAMGRLNTRQDRDRLLKGIDARHADAAVAGLQKREFLLHQIGRGDPEVLRSRHAICYLRGPITRAELARLRPAPKAPSQDEALQATSKPEQAPSAETASTAMLSLSRVSPLDVFREAPSVRGVKAAYLRPEAVFAYRSEGVFEAEAQPSLPDGQLLYRPALYAELKLRFDEARYGFVLDRRFCRVFFPLGDREPEASKSLQINPEDLEDTPQKGARFEALPDWMDEKKEFDGFAKALVNEVYGSETEGLFVNPGLKLYGKAGETRESFDARCEAAVEARVDAAMANFETRHRSRIASLRKRISEAELRLSELESDARSRKFEEVANLGGTLLSFFGGRKKRLSGTFSRRRQSAKAEARVDQAEAKLERFQDELEALFSEIKTRQDAEEAKGQELLKATELRAVRLEKADIQLAWFGLLWVPVSRRI